jgi:chromosome segregation ATPase
MNGTLLLIKRDIAMDIQEQTLQNSRDISTLTATVAKLGAMFESAEKVRDEDRSDLHSVVSELRSMNEKISDITGVKKDVNAVAADVRALRSDFDKRLKVLEVLKDQAEGASGVVKVLIHSIWAFASIGGFSFVAWLLTTYAQSQSIGAHIGTGW